MSGLRQHRLALFLCAVSLSTIAPFATAQTENKVVMESPDKSVVVSGELVEAANGQYRVSTIAGDIVMDINTVSCTGDACPELVLDFETGAEVELTSTDGAVNITGNLTDVVDNHYVVENPALGSIRIAMDLVECAGLGCPTGLLRFANEP